MKRLISLLLAGVLLLSLWGCSDGTPDGLTKETYRCGNDALATMDAYLAGEASAEDTLTKLEEIALALDQEAAALEKALAEQNVKSGKYDTIFAQSMSCAGITLGVVAFMSEVEAAPDGTEGTSCQRARDKVADIVAPAEE